MTRSVFVIESFKWSKLQSKEVENNIVQYVQVRKNIFLEMSHRLEISCFAS